MPPERHSTPPPRPPRDRYPGPGFGGGPRRSFSGGGGGFGGPRPPFSGPPPQPAPGLHTVRLREGDRELEATGTPDFVRQILDELPSLLARLRGEATPPSRPASIAMPPPPARATGDEELAAPDTAPDAAPAPQSAPPTSHRRNRHAANGNGSLESRVFSVLEHADHPLSVAAIRRELGDDSTGQQIRRILERAADRVVASTERPAAYSLR